MKRYILIIIATIFSLTLFGCHRATKYESSYIIDLDQKYSWKGMGPGLRWNLLPWRNMEKVSHMEKTMDFPQVEDLSETSETQLNPNQILALETAQSIITSDGQIMIQKIHITYNLKAEDKAVRSYFLGHREEDRQFLLQNLDGLVRSFLQTKTRAYVEKNQKSLGRELKAFISSFKVGGTPVCELDSKGKCLKYTGFIDGLSLEEEWGIEITGITMQRVKAPKYVLSAHEEAASIRKKGESEYESAKADAMRRFSKLRSLQKLIDAIGSNESAAKYLTQQITFDMLEDLGSDNVGRLRFISVSDNQACATNPEATKKLKGLIEAEIVKEAVK